MLENTEARRNIIMLRTYFLSLKLFNNNPNFEEFFKNDIKQIV